MQSIDFQEAQQRLNAFLTKKLAGEKQNGALERRAQRLVDKWWQSQKLPVIMGTSNLQVVGCTLGFDIGEIKVTRWHTKFVNDTNNVSQRNPSAVALGNCNGFQLFLVPNLEYPTLVALSPLMTHKWSVEQKFIPPKESPLFMALERAKHLGYLSMLRKQDGH